MRLRVVRTLSGYMSPAHAELALRRAISKAQTNARLSDESAYPRLAVALESSIRSFAPESKASVAIQEIRALLTPEPPEPVTLELHSEADISVARQAARGLAEKMGARSFAAQHFTTAVSELARNIVQYAGQGTVELVPIADEQRGLRVRATDQGPGIRQLAAVLDGTYASTTGLGKGITGVRRLMDRFEIDSGPSGTRVEAELYL